MRSIFAFIAAAWFAVQALDGGPVAGDLPSEAITWAARVLFAGLAFLSLAVVDWAWIVRKDRELRGDDQPPVTGPDKR